MATDIVFETHALSEDNDAAIATGWLPGRLSARGRELAAELGERRRDDGITTVFTSDLRRATETADIAFGDTEIPILHDWRLRECDFGQDNGAHVKLVHADRLARLEVPYPHGESWRQAVHRAAGFLHDLPLRWDGHRVLLIGHVATRWALDHVLNGVPIEELAVADFGWREGWEYRMSARNVHWDCCSA